MSAVVSPDYFIELLSRSGLLTADEVFARAEREGWAAKDSLTIARELVKSETLTRFQAERLLLGRWRRLVIDGYRILEPLGAGGMGWVFIGQEIAGGWKVAIKILSDKYRDRDGMLARFQLEARNGMRLKHPNILRTLELKTAEDIYGKTHYVVMELIQGINLHELRTLSGPLPIKQVCDFIQQAANGLHYAHEQGMVHRDVKPENLLVRANGTVKLLDFGLAMFDENDQEFAMAMIHGQDCLGTADYVSPEQSIDSYRVDRRADIYSLGCTLYYALTGQVPFPVDTSAKKILCHRTKRPRPIRELNPEVPERLELIVRKMMAKQPDHRLATAAEVAAYLAPFSERLSIDLDFRGLLKARERLARTMSGTQSATRHTGELSGSVPEVSDSTVSHTGLQARQETRIRRDTQVVAPEPESTDAALSPESADGLRRVAASEVDGGSVDPSASPETHDRPQRESPGPRGA